VSVRPYIAALQRYKPTEQEEAAAESAAAAREAARGRAWRILLATSQGAI
jgi:hypothetical protein